MLIIGAIILLSVGFSMYSQNKSGSKIEVEGKSAATLTQPMWPQIAFTLGIMALFVFTFMETINLSQLGRIFPVSIAVVGMATAAMVLWPQIRGNRSSGAVFDAESKEVSDQLGPMTPLKYIGWLVGFVAAIALVGYFLAVVLFFVAFLRIVARSGWVQILLLTLMGAIILLILTSALNLILPEGLLQNHFYDRLPWPLVS